MPSNDPATPLSSRAQQGGAARSRGTLCSPAVPASAWRTRTSLGLFVLVLAVVSSLGQTPSAAKEPPTSTLEGRVLKDPGGVPVKKAEVQLIAEGQEEESSSYTASSDADGHFKIEGIRSGRYRAFVERTGLVEIDKRNRRSPGTALFFDAGKDITDVVLRMLPAAVVVGKVIDEDGDPMPRTDVSVLRYAYTLGKRHLETAASGTTNDLGEYRIPDLLPGRYLVVATPTPEFSNLAAAPNPKTETVKKQETAYVPTFYPGTTDQSQAAFLELRAGDETPVDFNLVRSQTFHVRGSIANFAPRADTNAVLILRGKDSNSEFTAAQVDKDGKFEMSHVAPGSYTVFAVVGSGDPPPQISRQALEVTNHDIADLRIVPLAGSQVRGQIRVEGNRTLDFSSLLVFLRSSDHDSAGMFGGTEDSSPTLARVKRDGTFELKSIPAGSYTVLVEGTSRMPDLFLKSVKAGSTDVTGAGLNLGGGGTFSIDVLIGSGAAKLDGSVVDGESHPAADAIVVAVPSGDLSGRLELYQKTVTDQHGHFSLAGITPGSYALFAFDSIEEGAYFDPAFLKPYEGAGESIHLDENAHKTLQLKVIPAVDNEP